MAGLIARNSLNFFGSVFQSSVGYLISIINPTWRSENLITNLSAVVTVPAGIGLPQENLRTLVCLRKISKNKAPYKSLNAL